MFIRIKRTRERPILEGPAFAGGYSDLKLFTGLARAALMAWKLMVASAISRASTGRARYLMSGLLYRTFRTI